MDDDLTQLAKALGAADLVTALSGPGPFTVLAPTDDAFEELGKAPTGVCVVERWGKIVIFCSAVLADNLCRLS